MIRRLAWESEFFGFDIAQLELEGPAPDLTAVDRFLASHRPALVQAIVPISEINLANLLEANGFYLADIRVSFRIEVAEEPRAAPSARVASHDDIAELRELAAELFVDSRFFHPVFPQEKARLLYSSWIERGVLGSFDDICLVLARRSPLTAFITLRHRADNPVIIGLIGVRKSEQHTGAGSEIMDAALAWSAARGAKSIDVSTQGKNLAAQNLYITKGGRLRQMAAWFYRHSPTGDNR
jgi:dTDP-4-amino-4,6-dideoxy-D-galactose acyltransferase